MKVLNGDNINNLGNVLKTSRSVLSGCDITSIYKVDSNA